MRVIIGKSAGEPLITPVATVHRLKLTSQTWHGIVWEHDLQLVIPTGVKLAGPVLIWNQGGREDIGATLMATHLAIRAQAPVAFLYGVPKQPLFGDKREDALIAETFVKYLETGDPTWPLLFPMVKSVVRSMDAIQEFAKKELNSDSHAIYREWRKQTRLDDVADRRDGRQARRRYHPDGD